MKKKRRTYLPLPKPPTAAYDIRHSRVGERDHLEAGLLDAINGAKPRAFVLVVAVSPALYEEFRKGWAEGITACLESGGGTDDRRPR